MDKVVLRILAAIHVFGVAVIDVPDANAGYHRKQFGVLAQRVGAGADVDAFADKVAGEQIRIVQPPLDRFAEFVHASSRTRLWRDSVRITRFALRSPLKAL